MTIDTIASASYSVDGGPLLSAFATDGAFGGYSEDIGFTVTGLGAGTHLIDVLGYSSVGNAADTLHYSFTVAVPEPAAFTVLALGCLAFLRPRK